MKTAVIYARYSCDHQTEQSIEGQLRVCSEYAQRNEIVVVDTYIDRAMTGTNDKRIEFQRMLRDSSKRAWDYVIVYKIDRFGRNKYELAMNKHTLKLNGIRVLSAMENIPDTPEGIILESLLEGMAEYYSAELSQKVKRGMRETRAKGNFSGGFLLYGYKVENKKVVIKEDEAAIIRRIFSDCASGKLVNTIYEELKAENILNKRGKPFSRSSVYYMLACEKYAGIYRYGDEVYTNIFPRIVPDEIFAIVQSKIANNKYGKHKPDVYYLLRNRMFCGYCGKPVHSDAGTSHNGTIKRYYKCSGKRTSKDCPLNPIRKELIEELVIDILYEALTKDNINLLIDKILESHKKRIADQSILNLLTSELKETERAINNILSAIEQGIFTSSTKDRLEELEKKKNNLLYKLTQEQSNNRLLINKDDISKHLLSALKKDPRPMVDSLVKKVILYNDKVEIYLNYGNKKRPDDEEDHQAFIFYTSHRRYEIEPKHFSDKVIVIELEIVLLA